MQKIDFHSLEPFELCSIRPPTENFSLTFKLSRNCYWNKCRFCPVYKRGQLFSKRTFEDIRDDVDRAKKIDDLLYDHGIGVTALSEKDHDRAAELLEQISSETLGQKDHVLIPENINDPEEEIDPRLKWFLQWFRDDHNIFDSVEHILNWRLNGAKNCFLGDADSLIYHPEFIARVMKHIKNTFPSLERFTIYCRTRTAAEKRTFKDLMSYKSS